MALIKCPECNNDVSDLTKTCIHCGFPLKVKEKKKLSIKIDLKNLSQKNKLLLIIIPVVVLVLSITGISIGAIKKNKTKKLYAETYSNLKYEMNNFSLYSDDRITNYLATLPKDYLDTEDIRSDFLFVKRHTNTISSASGALRSTKSELAREAYIELHDFQKVNYNWTFKSYFNQKLDVLIFGADWEDYPYSLQWYDLDTAQRLLVQLPNEMEAQKDYYFTVEKKQDHILFGYENIQNKDDSFIAYKVHDFRYIPNTYEKFEIKLFNYSNNRTYTMTAVK